MAAVEGSSHEARGRGDPSYMPTIDPGRHGGGTYTAQATEPTLQDYENIFGPSARDIKSDLQRYKRHGRWHLPDALKGPNPFLTDRVDGLITDATNSPFTTKILPYKFQPNPDGKFKWNVWSFDEGMASRVPYESAARTLTQTKRSFAGYTVRQGLAIVMEHNFMMSDKGRQNFKDQLQQLVGSIQYTNDLDVHVALVLAPSHQKHMRERYYIEDKTPTQVCREFVDLFGFVQKNQNALDILIEEAKAQLKSWGGPMPDFMLCNSKLTFQLTMTPERTNYLTQGTDGVKRLRTGPDLASYRGLNIIHSRSFSMDPGTPPRDILRRRVRVAEYYRITPHKDNWRREFQFYNEERDTWFTYSFKDLLQMARYQPTPGVGGAGPNRGHPGNNHNLINHSINAMRGLSAEAGAHMGTGMMGADGGTDGDSNDDSSHLSMSLDDAPTHTLGANLIQQIAPGPFLGLNINGVHDASKLEIIVKVAEAALDSNWPNWEPGGDFITDDIFFALGAVSWNKFYVQSDNARVAAANQQNRFIPPEKYYFCTEVEPLDEDMNNAGNAFGAAEALPLQNTLKNSTSAVVRKITTVAYGAYGINNHGAGGSMIQMQGRDDNDANKKRIAYIEQCKVTMALLIEAFCEYPRLVSKFSENSHSRGAVRANLNAVFLHTSGTNNDFSTSIRFRNWMRYGVSPNLLSNRRYNHNSDQGMDTKADTAMRTNTVLLPFRAGNNILHPLPWNKTRQDTNAAIIDPSNPMLDNAFAISTGSRTHHMYNYAAAPAPGVGINWPSTTIFGNTRDDGVVHLREPGAFLAPNHFHVLNDAYTYHSVGSYIGGNIILTSEIIHKLLNRPPNPHNTPVISQKNTIPYLENTLLHTILLNYNRIKPEKVNQIYNLLKRAWDNLYTQPEEAHKRFHAIPAAPPPPAPAAPPPPAPAAGGGGGGAAPPAPPAPPVPPARSNYNRVNLTKQFIADANVNTSAENDLLYILNAIANELNLTNQHPERSYVWTWNRTTHTEQEIWCQPATDYRLQSTTPGPLIAHTAATAAEIIARFPDFQVGNEAIREWDTNLENDSRLPAAAAPLGAALTAPDNTPPQNHYQTWAFTKTLSTRPTNTELGIHHYEVMAFFYQIYTRLVYDQAEPPYIRAHGNIEQHTAITEIFLDPVRVQKVNAPYFRREGGMYAGRITAPKVMPSAWPNPNDPDDPGNYFPPGPGGPRRPGGPGGPHGPHGPHGRRMPPHGENLDKIELVIVRPNIEHHMLGIIMGQGGEGLGNTLWGQTELSCYDDSMHGIWGMSYKYHERAIVFNEKNLVRLWDVAYDGYCGGKDATAVEWLDNNKVSDFKIATQDITQNYKGPSMMVMAFVHDNNSPEYMDNYKRNWPSPIVFHDGFNHDLPAAQQPSGDYTLTMDPDNVHVTNVKDFRVFNNPLYAAYRHYFERMPNFSSLHQIRKSAGNSAHENETYIDSLAFQGTMKTLEEGREVDHVQGSGHHGPDWVGVASIRSGKGHKVSGPLNLQRLI